MTKITKKDVLGMFNRLVITYKKAMKTKGENSCPYSLDYNGTYGGWLVVDIDSNGGESHPFTSNRLPTREMYNALHMAATCLEDFKRGR